MRFSAPRSLSPSPVRGPQSRSTFGLVDYDSSDDSEPHSDDSSSESDVPQPPPYVPRAKIKTTAEQRHIQDTIDAIRLRTRHHDPYEEWEKQTRKDAFRVARKDHAAVQIKLHDERDRARVQGTRKLEALHTRQMAEVEGLLGSLKLKQQTEDEKLRQAWQERDKLLWQRIDSGIKLEEDKVRARLEAERKVREAEERKRQEEQTQKRQLEEKQRKEEEERRKAAEEAERRQKEEEKKIQDEDKLRVQEEKDKATRLEAEAGRRQAAGLTTPTEDWRNARSILTVLKANTMKPIKSDKAARSVWGVHRRKITPKIGQLTNDNRAIRDITDYIQNQIIKPSPPHPPILYTGLLSSLAKTILLQAETEVTAEKKAAIPLAQVTFALLDRMETFADIFFAKLVQRCGGWPIPCGVPATDVDGRPWANAEERAKAMGFRRSVAQDVSREPVAEYMTRVAGDMRLYFHILRIPPQTRPMHPMFQLPRCWTWFSRILGNRALLESPVAAQLMYSTHYASSVVSFFT
ncbi:GLE1-like protein-domain-containing protein, partial [Mycena pura]